MKHYCMAWIGSESEYDGQGKILMKADVFDDSEMDAFPVGITENEDGSTTWSFKIYHSDEGTSDNPIIPFPSGSADAE